VDVATAIRETSTWPIEDQLELVEELWDRIVGAGWQPEVDAELQAVLDKRADELDANPGRAVSWDQLAQSVRSNP
jgi:putative addiction module component (TIGR02574 family)